MAAIQSLLNLLSEFNRIRRVRLKWTIETKQKADKQRYLMNLIRFTRQNRVAVWSSVQKNFDITYFTAHAISDRKLRLLMTDGSALIKFTLRILSWRLVKYCNTVVTNLRCKI